jgi:hypothetical protein
MGVLEGADGFGNVALKALYVAGPDDAEIISEVTGREVVTLPPCDECRPRLSRSRHTTPELSVTTIAPGDPPYVEQNALGSIVMEYAELVAPLPSISLVAG